MRPALERRVPESRHLAVHERWERDLLDRARNRSDYMPGARRRNHCRRRKPRRALRFDASRSARPFFTRRATKRANRCQSTFRDSRNAGNRARLRRRLREFGGMKVVGELMGLELSHGEPAGLMARAYHSASRCQSTFRDSLPRSRSVLTARVYRSGVR